MRLLYHHPLLASARKVRLALHEKRLFFEEKISLPWEREEAILRLNPAGEMPVLVDEDGTTVFDPVTICEYLEEVYPEPALIRGTPAERAEARRLAAWFDHKFQREVIQHLVVEKLVKRAMANHAPDSRALKVGRDFLVTHLQYIGELTEQRGWVAGSALTLADLAAAANISLVDYCGDVPWESYPAAKEWYVRIKSRPSFRSLLRDVVPGIPPAPIYADLDF
ncbi:MAG: glutathione S-transferase family protein [Rhodospirillaceae bacterium]|nr:glutathione S-transferase family protein [Rhodospirillaceae bacterium]